MCFSINSNIKIMINNNKKFRCPKCSIIPFINIFTNVMSMKCTNNHIIQKHLMKCILSGQTFEENENDQIKF